MTADKTPAKLVVFGAGGDTVHLGRTLLFTDGHGKQTYSGSATVQGYGDPERPHAADPDKYNIPDGTPALDLREAVRTPEGYKWVFKGPMVDVELADGEAEPFKPGDLCITRSLAEANGSFAAMLALQAVSKYGRQKRGPLDQVSIAEYLLGWQEHGARIGHYEKGRIVWHG